MATEEFNQLLNGSSSRLTNHPEDNDVAERLSSAHLSSDEDDHAAAATQHPEDDNEPLSSRPYNTVVPQRRYQANTGPKGVIADAQKFREARRGVHGGQRVNGGAGVTQQEEGAAAGKKFGDREKEEKGEKSDDDFDGLEDDEDDDFMANWRSSRMQEIRKGGASAFKTQTTQRGARTYGSLMTVDAAGYLHAVDHSPPGTLVLVYIYDDDSDVSIAIEEALRDLAQMRPSVRFVRLHFVEAEMEPAGVPALLAYADGEKFAGLVPVVDELPDEGELSAETLEGVLRRHRILR